MCTSHLSDSASLTRRQAIPCLTNLAVFATLVFVLPIVCLGQVARPAIIPSASSGSAASSNAPISPNSIGELTDGPISPGDTVHVMVFDAPDFSTVMRVSESGDVAVPMLGVIHIEGLSSATASKLIASQLKARSLMPDPHVTVTVDSSSTGITVLGEVRNPGIYPPPGKHLLSDLLAAAGGLTANTGRVIEISNHRTPDKKTYIPWDPTMHNTSGYDQPIQPGDRVLVRACGIAYVGGNVIRPGAYSLCGSPQMTLSEVIALAGGISPLSSQSHTFLVRVQPDGAKVVRQIDVKKVLTAKVADPIVHEDDIVYVSPSPLKEVANRALGYAMSLAGPLIYVAHP